MVRGHNKHYWRWWHIVSIGLALVISTAYALLRAARADEISYVDPGAQLVLVGRMESTAWLSNSPLDPWGASNPGIPLLFAAWFKLFGFGWLQARACFILLHLAGVALLFRWIDRRFSPSATSITVGIVATLILPSLANAIFLCRLEAVALLLSAWFLTYTWQSEPGVLVDWVAAPLLGAITIMLGFHHACFFALASLAVFVFKPNRRTLIQGLGLAAGILVGLLLLWLFYSKTGRWEALVEGRASHFFFIIPWDATGWRKYFVTVDMPVWGALAAFGLLSTTVLSRPEQANAWRPWISALAIFVLAPQLIGGIGIYYGSYAWMPAVLMMVGFYAGIPWLNGRAKGVFLAVASLTFISLGLFYVFRLPGLAREADQRLQVRNAVERSIAPHSSVAADFSLYYELVGAGYRTFLRVKSAEGLSLGFTQERYFPKSIHNSVTCIATKASSAAEMIEGIGGRWRLTAEFPLIAGEHSDEDYQVYLRE